MANKSFSTSLLPEPLTVKSIAKEVFQRELQGQCVPIVIKGFADDWPIVKQAKQKHADMAAYLHSMLNEKSPKMSLTRIPFSEQSRMFYSPDMHAMNFGVASLHPQNCFERMTQTNRDADYATQCAPVSSYFPSLTDALHNPLVPANLSPFIWFGNKVIVAPHFDESDNIAVVAAGKRRFTLFPPQQTKNLYIGPLEFTPAGQPISLVDILNPDLSAHPHYMEAYNHGLSVELGPGDAIYIPSPWWHHVQSLSEFNILINYWWNESTLTTAKPLAALLHSMQAFKSLPKAQRQAFKAMLDYYVFDDELTTHQHIPEHAKGLLSDLNATKRVALEEWIEGLLQK